MTAQPYQKILVPIDGSDSSQAALQRGIAFALAAGDQAVLSLLTVVDTRAYANLASFDDQLLDQVTQDVKNSLDHDQEVAKKAGVAQVEYLIEFGSPKEMIAHQVPKELGTDLIVMGAGQPHAIERFILGSVAHYVSQAAAADVLIVREPAK
ncbi:universal stress protein [Leuconostocaceae bacterium ESL0723]|nr:universal stress protein [Leuconostocaceae bacterium ESL0723]